MEHEILLGLTTTPHSDWRGKVEEMKKFGIKRIALFPTFLDIEKRKELYALLAEIQDLEIPHVHLREEDMEAWEMEWFEARGVVAYNTHAGNYKNEAIVPYAKKVFIENHPLKAISQDQIELYAGICLDFQHWHLAKKIKPDVARKTELNANKFKIGCCHMSAMPKWKNIIFRFIAGEQEEHYMQSLDEMDYLKSYSDFFPPLMSIELENSFEQQLEIKAYLEKILDI